MVKFPYVEEYSLFEQVEVRCAEELLREYNDFYLYNKTQYNDIFRRAPISSDDDEVLDEKTEEELKAKAELNAKQATEHFIKLFGSKDFAESSLVGLKISWYDLQQILLDEYRKKTPAQQSAMNDIAPRLHSFASTLLFAEYFITKLTKMHKNNNDSEKCRQLNEKLDKTKPLIKDFFTKVITALSENPRLRVPEYAKSKNALAKLKTVEGIIDYCEQSFQLS